MKVKYINLAEQLQEFSVLEAKFAPAECARIIGALDYWVSQALINLRSSLEEERTEENREALRGFALKQLTEASEILNRPL